MNNCKDPYQTTSKMESRMCFFCGLFDKYLFYLTTTGFAMSLVVFFISTPTEINLRASILFAHVFMWEHFITDPEFRVFFSGPPQVSWGTNPVSSSQKEIRCPRKKNPTNMDFFDSSQDNFFLR